MGSSEPIPYFTVLAYVAFALPIKLSLPQPMSFLTFTFLILSLIPLRRVSEWVVLRCLLGLKHNTPLKYETFRLTAHLANSQSTV